jgi:ribosomal protein L40E
MAYQCPKCGAWNYPNSNTNYGCECCGYTGLRLTTSNGTGDSQKLKSMKLLIGKNK